MKKIFSITFLLLSSLIYSQNSTAKLFDFKIQDKKLSWSHVYDSDLNANDLKSNLTKNVSLSNGMVDLIKSENSISFNIYKDVVDYKSLGGKWSNTPDFVKYPQHYKVHIDIKDKKYIVTVKDIEVTYGSSLTMRTAEFNDDSKKSKLIDIVSAKTKTEFNSKKSIKNGLNYIHKHFLNTFDQILDINEVEQ